LDHITAEEHQAAFKQFFKGNEWIPGMGELAIATDARTTTIGHKSLCELREFKKLYYQKHGITHTKIAIYAPGDLAFGIARMYDMITDESPEEVMAFRDVREAIRWLRD